MARILNFGSLNIDHVYRVDAFVRPGETKSSLSLEDHCGGKGLNQSVAAARAGAEVFHAGLIGRDGDMLLQKLVECGVNCSLLEHSEGVSGHAIIQVDAGGQNCILLHGGTNRMLTEAYVDSALEAFGNRGLVLLQNETNLAGSIIARAKAKGHAVALNAAPMDEAVFSYPLEQLDWLIVNEVEGAAIARCTREEEILPALEQAYPRLNVLLTLGERGSVCALHDEQTRFGAYRVKAADTTAAGDTFLGYFLDEIADGANVSDALALATAAAALCVQAMGAADSIPPRERVLSALSSGELGELRPWGGWR
ncbi:MAG TPA: ribokinase [Candidatus Cryosericum sp.]|nr:ribokinase [Candidatus Cryosericum sp.]